MKNLIKKIQKKLAEENQVITLTEREIINNYLENEYDIVKLMFSSYNTDKVNMFSIAVNHELTEDEINSICKDFNCDLFEEQNVESLYGYSFRLKHEHTYIVTPEEKATYNL